MEPVPVAALKRRLHGPMDRLRQNQRKQFSPPKSSPSIRAQMHRQRPRRFWPDLRPGQRNINGQPLTSPKLIRFTELTEDEYFCKEEGAKAGVTSKTPAKPNRSFVSAISGPTSIRMLPRWARTAGAVTSLDSVPAAIFRAPLIAHFIGHLVEIGSFPMKCATKSPELGILVQSRPYSTAGVLFGRDRPGRNTASLAYRSSPRSAGRDKLSGQFTTDPLVATIGRSTDSTRLNLTCRGSALSPCRPGSPGPESPWPPG